MSFQFQRHIKNRPGVRLNTSASGIFTSFGLRGAYATAGSGKQRITFGVPGTGSSYTAIGRIRRAVPPMSAMNALSGVLVMVFAGIVIWHVAFA